jgi:CelD/BcsL family acetyltransferase involved in cellulose biosynthesis
VISVRWLDAGSLSEQDRRRWTELAESTTAPNPFYERDFVLTAYEHFGSPQVQLLVGLNGAGDWVGLMPVERARRWRHLVGAALTGWMHPYCFLESPLIARGFEESAAEAMLDHARRTVGLTAFDRLPAEGPVASAVASACDALGVKPIVWQSFERAALERRAEDDYVRSMLGSKHYRELGRKSRKLERELGEAVAVVDRAGDPQAVDDFLALEAAGWKGDEGTALASGPGAGLFRAICHRFAEAGRLQMLALEAGDRTVAMQCCLIAGEGLFCFKIAYDEALARFSPGTQLMVETASEFHRRPELQWVDSCSKPNSEPLERLWPDRRRLVTMLVPGVGAKGGAVSAEARVAAALRAALRSDGQVQRPSATKQSEQPVSGGS